MIKYRVWALILMVFFVGISYFSYATEPGPECISIADVCVRIPKADFLEGTFPFKLGLDLAGGTQLVYTADTSLINDAEVFDSMDALRDVIERRVNLFGVSEPVVQVEQASALGGVQENKLIVDLPGVTDIDDAIRSIGETPILEFRLLREDAEELSTTTPLGELFTKTELTGRYLSRAQVEFDPTSGQPLVTLQFNAEGREIFARITRENTGRVLAIFLDDQPISTPVIREEIREGTAQITGGFTLDEAKRLVRDLNYGALPVPIELAGTQTIGPSLGQDALFAGVRAGVWGFLLVVVFMILWYRLPGLIASVALMVYASISLAIFKLIPVTLTAAGLAGFILSIGMAVDANILIFERMKEEMRRGKDVFDSVREGFSRAWFSIRDSNISSIITAIVLFWLGTSAVKGFALTLGIGVMVSMFTAITVSRTFLFAVAPTKEGKLSKFLLESGLWRNKS